MWFFNYVRHCLVTLYALHAKNVIIIQSFITWLFIVIFHILQDFDKGWTAMNIYNMKFNSCQYLKSVWCLQCILSCVYLLNNIQERDSTKKFYHFVLFTPCNCTLKFHYHYCDKYMCDAVFFSLYHCHFSRDVLWELERWLHHTYNIQQYYQLSYSF